MTSLEFRENAAQPPSESPFEHYVLSALVVTGLALFLSAAEMGWVAGTWFVVAVTLYLLLHWLWQVDFAIFFFAYNSAIVAGLFLFLALAFRQDHIRWRKEHGHC